MRQHKGVFSADFDSGRKSIALRYDPEFVDLHTVQRLANESGAQLADHYDRCEFRLAGGSCASCGNGLEHRLSQIPGLANINVNFATGRLALEYRSNGAGVLEAIQEKVRSAGYESTPAGRYDDQVEAASWRRMVILTAICGTGILVGLALSLRAVNQLTGLNESAISILRSAIFGLAGVAGGVVSARVAYRSLISLAFNVDLLMIVAALGAAAVGYWEEGAVLMFLFSLSNTLEAYALGRTRRAIRSLAALTPKEALVRRGESDVTVPIELLQPGDIVIVRPGQRIPADGVAVAGESSIDNSAMTGESMPVDVRPGDYVHAGAINQHGALEIRATKRANDTTLAKIIKLVEEAQSQKSNTQRFIDKIGDQYTTAVLAITVLTLLALPTVFQWSLSDAFYRAMTLLVVASPCAVVISTPAAILSAIANAARNGVLFKGGAYLENLSQVKAILFDKTGTLTVGKPAVITVRPADGFSEGELLAIAATAESRSEHHLGRAIVEAATARKLSLLSVADFTAQTGQGLTARVDGEPVWLGTEDFLRENGFQLDSQHAASLDEVRSKGQTAVLVGMERSHSKRLVGLIGIADRLRDSSLETVQRLRRLGVNEMVMLTGDNPAAAAVIAGQLGIRFQAKLMPQDKVTFVRRMLGQHGKVAMVGDGVNDAPALAAATIGVAIGVGGTDVALETADVVLVSDNLTRLVYAYDLSRRSNGIIRQNLAFAFTVIAGLILGAFAGWLTLPMAVVGHEGSTLIVVANGLRLLAGRAPVARRV